MGRGNYQVRILDKNHHEIVDLDGLELFEATKLANALEYYSAIYWVREKTNGGFDYQWMVFSGGELVKKT